MQLSEARRNASSSIGVMVAMNRLIDSSLFRDVLDRKVLPYVEAKLPGLHFRLHKSYSLLLMVTNVVRIFFFYQWFIYLNFTVHCNSYAGCSQSISAGVK